MPAIEDLRHRTAFLVQGVALRRGTETVVTLRPEPVGYVDGVLHLAPGEDPATAHIPVVALSANAIPRDIQKGLEAGFFRYLTKPIKVNEFMATLDVALEFAQTRPARASEEKTA